MSTVCEENFCEDLVCGIGNVLREGFSLDVRETIALTCSYNVWVVGLEAMTFVRHFISAAVRLVLCDKADRATEINNKGNLLH